MSTLLQTASARVAPGIIAAVAVAGASLLLERLLAPVVGAVLVAMVLGLVVGNLAPGRALLAPGLDVASKRGLRLAVILLGTQVTFGQVLSVGGTTLGAILACMAVALGAVVVLARFARIPPDLAVLIAAGTAICGNTAIVATSSVIDARQRDVSFAVGTITILGTGALFGFPILGEALGLSDFVYGVWAGLAINDTSQVVAAGAAFSDAALHTATIVKLVRNTMLAPILFVLAWAMARRRGGGDSREAGSVSKAFPVFVLGFLGLAVARSVGVVTVDMAEVASSAITWLVPIAIGAVGLATDVRDLRKTGIRPFLVGLGAASLLWVVGLQVSRWLGA